MKRVVIGYSSSSENKSTVVFVCVKRVMDEIIGSKDGIHPHDPGFRGAEWAREASVFARTAFGHDGGSQRRMHTASALGIIQYFTSLGNLDYSASSSNIHCVFGINQL